LDFALSNSAKHVLILIGSGALPHETPLVLKYLIPLLIETDRRVTVLTDGPFHDASCIETVVLIDDISNRKLVENLLDQVEEIIYFSLVPENSEDYGQAFKAHTENLLFEAAKRALKLILISSGGAIYGNVNCSKISEETKENPITNYGLNKYAIENSAYLYAKFSSLNLIRVRVANVYGPGQKPNAGQGFISNAISNAIINQVVQLYGSERSVRDYIYVSDFASGIVAVLNYGVGGEIYNIGSGIALSNHEVLTQLQTYFSTLGKIFTVSKVESDSNEVISIVLDSSKLMSLSGWRPVVDFGEGLRQTYEWMRNYVNYES
jgi:UDP-glucose 4-epimerase